MAIDCKCPFSPRIRFEFGVNLLVGIDVARCRQIELHPSRPANDRCGTPRADEVPLAASPDQMEWAPRTGRASARALVVRWAVARPRWSALAARSSHANRSPRPLPSSCWRRSSRPLLSPLLASLSVVPPSRHRPLLPRIAAACVGGRALPAPSGDKGRKPPHASAHFSSGWLAQVQASRAGQRANSISCSRWSSSVSPAYGLAECSGLRSFLPTPSTHSHPSGLRCRGSDAARKVRWQPARKKSHHPAHQLRAPLRHRVPPGLHTMTSPPGRFRSNASSAVLVVAYASALRSCLPAFVQLGLLLRDHLTRPPSSGKRSVSFVFEKTKRSFAR